MICIVSMYFLLAKDGLNLQYTVLQLFHALTALAPFISSSFEVPLCLVPPGHSPNGIPGQVILTSIKVYLSMSYVHAQSYHFYVGLAPWNDTIACYSFTCSASRAIPSSPRVYIRNLFMRLFPTHSCVFYLLAMYHWWYTRRKYDQKEILIFRYSLSIVEA